MVYWKVFFPVDALILWKTVDCFEPTTRVFLVVDEVFTILMARKDCINEDEENTELGLGDSSEWRDDGGKSAVREERQREFALSGNLKSWNMRKLT